MLDTSRTSIHELRDIIRRRVGAHEQPGLSILFESFGYKHGIPADADFVFDLRCLPNPYWEAALRHLTGRDRGVIEFLSVSRACSGCTRTSSASWTGGFPSTSTSSATT